MSNIKDIVGYEGLYQITSDGKVYSLYSHRYIKTHITKCGYERIKLYKNHKSCQYDVHRLVAEAFIPNNDNKEQVNHIDGNKLNNYLSNLEWVTAEENIEHAKTNHLFKSTCTTPPIRTKDGPQIGYMFTNVYNDK